MKLGFWKLMGPCGMLNQSEQPTRFEHSWLQNTTYQQWGYQITEISMMLYFLHEFVYDFSTECCVFTPQMTLAVGSKLLHNLSISYYALVFMALICWLGLLKKYFLCFYLSVRYVYALSKFLLHIFHREGMVSYFIALVILTWTA
jgi:hypothetical protein